MLVAWYDLPHQLYLVLMGLPQIDKHSAFLHDDGRITQSPGGLQIKGTYVDQCAGALYRDDE